MPKNNNKEIEYSSPFNVNNQIYFCGVPFRLDSYSGCTHHCSYCLHPDTAILMADLTHKAIDGIEVGDKIVGYDEYPVNNQRHIKMATVLGIKRHKTEIYGKCTRHFGETLCTGDHPWLHSRGGSWARPETFMRQGTSLRHLLTPVGVGETPEYQLGYIAGMFDAKGSMRYTPGQPSYYTPSTPYFVIGQAENNLEALTILKYYLEKFGFERIDFNRRKLKAGQRFFILQMQDLDRVRKYIELLNNRPEDNITI